MPRPWGRARGGRRRGRVYSNSPAAAAGLTQSDVIVGYDGTTVDDYHHLQRLVAETEVGKQIVLDIIRKGEKQSVKVKIAEGPDAAAPKEKSGPRAQCYDRTRMASTLRAPVETLADLVARLGHVPLERIRLHPAPGTATEADVLVRPGGEKRLCELVDGVLVEKTVGYYESLLASPLVRFLWRFLDDHDLGFVLGPDARQRGTRAGSGRGRRVAGPVGGDGHFR